jgi:hypothetical protein
MAAEAVVLIASRGGGAVVAGGAQRLLGTRRADCRGMPVPAMRRRLTSGS